jgi:hypothetical protein
LPSSHKDLIYQKVVGGSPANRSKEAKATAAVSVTSDKRLSLAEFRDE